MGGASPAYADAKSPLSIEAKIGAQYDSSISIDQTDLNARQGDAALVLGLSGRYRAFKSGATNLAVGYDFDQTRYQDLTNYNLQIHSPSVSAAAKMGDITLSGEYRFYHMRLGGNAFLDMHMATPSVSGFFGPRLFWRAAYGYSRKDFATANKLDAETHSGDVGAWYFFNKRRSFISLSARYERENAADSAHDFKSWSLAVRAQTPLPYLGRDSRLRAGVAYRSRDYLGITPAIGSARREARYSYSLSADIPIGGGFIARPEWRNMDRHSNYAAADYVENITTLTLVYRR